MEDSGNAMIRNGVCEMVKSIEISESRKNNTRVSFSTVVLEIIPDDEGSTYVETNKTYLPTSCVMETSGQMKPFQELVPEFARSSTYQTHRPLDCESKTILKNSICDELTSDNTGRCKSAPAIKICDKVDVSRQPKSFVTMTTKDVTAETQSKSAVLTVNCLGGDVPMCNKHNEVDSLSKTKPKQK